MTLGLSPTTGPLLLPGVLVVACSSDNADGAFGDVVSTDVFSSINLDAPQYAPFRQQLLLGGALASAGVNPNDPAAVFAFATNPATAPIFAAFQAFAAANANNPVANPLGPLRALQFLPPFLNVPNAVEDNHVSDDNFSYTIPQPCWTRNNENLTCDVRATLFAAQPPLQVLPEWWTEFAGEAPEFPTHVSFCNTATSGRR